MHFGIILAIFVFCSIGEISCETEIEYDETPREINGVFLISPKLDRSLILTNTNRKSSDRSYAHLLVSTEAYSPNNAEDQQWEIKIVPKNEQRADDHEDKYRIKLDSKAVDNSEMSTFLAESVAYSSQVQWILDEIEEGTFVFKTAVDNKCLTFNGAGNYISKLDCTGEDNQIWALQFVAI